MVASHVVFDFQQSFRSTAFNLIVDSMWHPPFDKEMGPVRKQTVGREALTVGMESLAEGQFLVVGSNNPGIRARCLVQTDHAILDDEESRARMAVYLDAEREV
jgi:hypothetical protein